MRSRSGWVSTSCWSTILMMSSGFSRAMVLPLEGKLVQDVLLPPLFPGPPSHPQIPVRNLSPTPLAILARPRVDGGHFRRDTAPDTLTYISAPPVNGIDHLNASKTFAADSFHPPNAAP